MTTMTTEPRVTFNKSARTIKADYLIGTDHEGRDGAERRIFASFRVGYDKGGPNYFSGRTTPRSYSASISRVTEETILDRDGNPIGTSQSFTLFKGLGLDRSEPVGRYSEKGLREFYAAAKARFDELRFEEPRIGRYFDLEEDA
jgi:hypothetical protein